MTSTDGVIAMSMTILAMFGVGYLVNKEQRMDKLAKSVGMTVKEIRDANDIEIREAVVNKAVTDAVNRSVNAHMNSMSQDIYSQAGRTLRDKIASVVNDEVSRIRTTVQDRVYGQVNKVDISSIRRDIENSVKEKILEKLDDKLDELVDDITDDYSDKHKVYVIRK